MATPASVTVYQQLVGGPKLAMGTETISNAETTKSLDFSSYGGKGIVFGMYTFEGSATAMPLLAASTLSSTSLTAVFNFAAPTTTCTLKYILAIY